MSGERGDCYFGTIRAKKDSDNGSIHLACLDGDLQLVESLTNDVSIESRNNYGDTPLHCASIGNHLDVAKFLIGKGANFSARNDGKITPIHYACRMGYFDMVSLLITKRSYSTEWETVTSDTPLHYACLGRNPKVVKLVNDCSELIGQPNKFGDTPLHYACRGENSEIVEILLADTRKISKKNDSGETPLHIACSRGLLNIVGILIENGADVDTEGGDSATPLLSACKSGHLDVIKFLIGKGADVTKKTLKSNITPLHYACKIGSLEIAKLLIASGSEINVAESSSTAPIHYACRGKHTEIVDLLIGKGANIELANRYGLRAMHIACGKGDIDTVKLLIDKGADVCARDINGNIPICNACLCGRLDVFNLLIEKCCADIINNKGEGLLHHACSNKYSEEASDIVRVLIKSCNINAKSNNLETPLINASKTSNFEIIKLLIEGGAITNVRDNNGCTPLYFLCSEYCEMCDSEDRLCENHSKIVELLIDSGVSPNEGNNFGVTPLHKVACGSYLNLAKILISNGANVNSETTNNYETPLDYAFLRENEKMIRLLITNDSDINYIISCYTSKSLRKRD